MGVEGGVAELHVDRTPLLFLAQRAQVEDHKRREEAEAYALWARRHHDRMARRRKLACHVVLHDLLEVGGLVDAVDEQRELAHAVELLEHRRCRLVMHALRHLAGQVEGHQVGGGKHAGRGLPLPHQPRKPLHVHDVRRRLDASGMLGAAAAKVLAARAHAPQHELLACVEGERRRALSKEVEQLHDAPSLASPLPEQPKQASEVARGERVSSLQGRTTRCQGGARSTLVICCRAKAGVAAWFDAVAHVRVLHG